jgi:hypothetical protein
MMWVGSLEIPGRGKFYCANSIINPNFAQSFVPNCLFENVFLAYFGI